MYFSGQGKAFVAPIADGVLGVYRWLGNVPDLTLGFDASKFEHKESYSGQKLSDLLVPLENKSTITGTLEDFSPANAALAVRGKAVLTDAGSVVGELAPTGLEAGDYWALRRQKISALVVRDSADPAATLVLDTHYRVADAAFGSVEILDLAGFTQPLKANYTFGAATSVAFFTQGVTEVALRFEGVNTADSNKRVLAEFYRIALDPTKEFGLIVNEGVGKFSISGNVLVDPSKTNDLVFGQFGRLVYLDAA